MNNVRRAIHVFGHLLRAQALVELQYRANLVVQVFQTCVSVGTTLLAVGMVYGQVQALNGWTHAQMLALVGVYFMGSGLLRAFIRPNLVLLGADVLRGSLDYVLLKPVDTQLFASTRAVEIWPLIDVGVGAGVLGWATVQFATPVSVAAVALFVLSLLLGLFIIYCFLFMLATTVFWFVQVNTLVQLYESAYISARWPLSMYPKWMRLGLTFVIPISFVAYTPAQAVTSRLSIAELLLEALVTAAFMVAARCFFHVALRRYTSSSAD